MVVPRFVRLALDGEPIPVYGNGTQRRSFTWVGDVVGAVPALIGQPKSRGEILNISHTKDNSIYDLVVLVKTMTNGPANTVFVPYEVAYQVGLEDMPRRASDISRSCQFHGSIR